MRTEYSIAAVVFHSEKFLLLKYELGHWGLVKGNKGEKESDRETILREMEEETGITNLTFFNDFKEEYEYYYRLHGDLIRKKVVCYLIEAMEMDVNLSYDHVDYQWLEFDEAVQKATYENIKRILRKAKKYLEKLN